MIQLQKWKEEKEKKKKEVLAQKKRPFLVGTVKASLKFEPPPPVLWPLPSTSGRVTPSQASKDKASSKKQEQAKLYSFAPKNAVFNPKLDDLPMPSVSTFEKPYEKPREDEQMPDLRRLSSRTKLPDAGVKKMHTQSRPESASGLQNKTINKNAKKSVPNTKDKALKQINTSSSNDSNEEEMAQKTQKNKNTTRKIKPTGKTTKQNKLLTPKETKNLNSSLKSMDKNEENPQTKLANSRKPLTPTPPKMCPHTEKLVDLSNSFVNMEVDVEESNTLKVPKSIQNKSPHRKSNGTNETPIKMNETATKVNVTPIEMNETPMKTNEMQDLITFTPLHRVPKSESSSEEKLRSPKLDVPMTPQQVEEEAKKISPRVYLSRGKENTRKELKRRIAEGKTFLGCIPHYK